LKESGVNPSPDPMDDVLGRISSGDHEAAAEFVRSHEALIRRRMRHKLGSALRRTVDSEDLVSTLSRRLYVYMTSTRIEARSREQLVSLLMVIAERSVNDKLRALRRAEHDTGPEARWRAIVRERTQTPQASDRAAPGMDEALAALDSDVDREITRMWLRGMDHAEISVALGISHAAVRKRWERIRAKLRRTFEAA
jgi:RNA polymerase sigma factor (sigma-70 family)